MNGTGTLTQCLTLSSDGGYGEKVQSLALDKLLKAVVVEHGVDFFIFGHSHAIERRFWLAFTVQTDIMKPFFAEVLCVINRSRVYLNL